MSSTRKAQPGSALRQERYSSSPEFERGLAANLVARRCELLDSAEHRDLIWFLQLRSHQKGGLERLAGELLAAYPERNATPAMRRYGMKQGQSYTAAQVKAVRSEIADGEDRFPLKGETNVIESMLLPDLREFTDYESKEWAVEKHREATARANAKPQSYPVETFVDSCRESADGLADLLAEICLNPALDLTTVAPWYFPDLIKTLHEFKASVVEARRRELVFTELGRKVCDLLEYSLQSGCMVVMEGLARTGKTHAAKAWCEVNPGRARYVQVPSTNDEGSFLREIAKSLGVCCGRAWKVVQIRQRIEDVLQTSGLILVLDEAHYCFPVSDCRHSLPGRINWLMTALVNHNVPVALVTTPQFMITLKAVEKRTHWTSEQFLGRFGHYETLPTSVSDADLQAVSRVLLPEGDSRSIELLAKYAQMSAKYLAAIESTVRRARYLVSKDGRTVVSFSDLKRAIKESQIPSDNALIRALGNSPKVRKGAAASELAAPAPSNPASRLSRQPAAWIPGDREIKPAIAETTSIA